MIEFDRRECALKCTICSELMGVDPQKMGKETAMAPLRNTMQAEHQACEQYKDDPRRAQIERGYATRMRALIRGIN